MSYRFCSTVRTIRPTLLVLSAFAGLCTALPICHAELLAGAAKVDITSDDAGPVHGRLHARALALQERDTISVIVTLDVVAVGEIGYINNSWLPAVRKELSDIKGFDPKHLIVNASHCHGVPAKDSAARTVKAIREAIQRLEPVRTGVGTGSEDRIMENRRIVMKDGSVVDVRHAYSMPAEEDVAGVGPIDPEIGVLKLERVKDGTTLAVVYNFACHPIQGVPTGANTADITGFSSEVIEDNLDEGTVALFVQGCGGDINPAFYKSTGLPRNAEPLGNMLGLSTLKAVRKIKCSDTGPLRIHSEQLALPRADLADRIAAMDLEQERLLRALGGTTLNLKSFLPLVVRYRLSDGFPSYYSHSYLNEKQLGKINLETLDRNNRAAMDAYIRNIMTMEKLSRLQINRRLLEKHQDSYVKSGRKDLDVEVAGLRVGGFRMVTFPGELTVPIGLNLKKSAPHPNTFVAGYTNGYIYYCPTAEQLKNVGGAQEDSDCMLAPAWQQIFEDKALQILGKLE